MMTLGRSPRVKISSGTSDWEGTVESMSKIGRAFKERWDEVLTFVVVTVTTIIRALSDWR